MFCDGHLEHRPMAKPRRLTGASTRALRQASGACRLKHNEIDVRRYKESSEQRPAGNGDLEMTSSRSVVFCKSGQDRDRYVRGKPQGAAVVVSFGAASGK